MSCYTPSSAAEITFGEMPEAAVSAGISCTKSRPQRAAWEGMTKETCPKAQKATGLPVASRGGDPSSDKGNYA